MLANYSFILQTLVSGALADKADTLTQLLKYRFNIRSTDILFTTLSAKFRSDFYDNIEINICTTYLNQCSCFLKNSPS
ncbi:unnamed protein product [Coffea canephora]|uniref:Uncharacterized protein n=1 Tax=Coffea canephora TaxID=49390 RepID=A0A068VCH6_COFCA|nr:unnamed protein product [Coffea canephora]